MTSSNLNPPKPGDLIRVRKNFSIFNGKDLLPGDWVVVISLEKIFNPTYVITLLSDGKVVVGYVGEAGFWRYFEKLQDA